MVFENIDQFEKVKETHKRKQENTIIIQCLRRKIQKKIKMEDLSVYRPTCVSHDTDSSLIKFSNFPKKQTKHFFLSKFTKSRNRNYVS